MEVNLGGKKVQGRRETMDDKKELRREDSRLREELRRDGGELWRKG